MEIVEVGLELEFWVGIFFVGMYVKCGDIFKVWVIFDRLLEKNVVMWIFLIVGYV